MADDASLLSSSRHLITIEIIWWLIAASICALALFPIYSAAPNFPFFGINALFIIAFIILTRYIFFLKYSFLAQKQYVKAALIFISVPLIFNLVNNLNYFITYIDERSYDSFLGHLNSDKKSNLSTYIKTQMLLFGVGSIIGAVLFPIRMVISIWRVRNRGGV